MRPVEALIAHFMTPITEVSRSLEVFVEESFDGVLKFGLVVFDGEDEVAVAVDDVPRDVFLATHGVDGDQGVFKLDLLQ